MSLLAVNTPDIQVPEVHPDARPFFHQGSDSGIGVVLIHGLTASPTEVQPIANAILSDDPTATVSCPLLPGHGTTPEHLRHTPGQAWSRTVTHEIDRIADRCGDVNVVGLSLGGVLAAEAALDDSRVRTVALLAPVFGLGRMRSAFVALVRPLLAYHRKGSRSLENHRAKGLFSYDRYPLNSLRHLTKLGRSVRARLAEIKVPVLIAGGHLDRYVSWSAIESLAGEIGSDQVVLVNCPSSGHVLPHEPDAELLCDAILEFLARHNKRR